MGWQTNSDTMIPAAQAKMRPALVRLPARMSAPTKANLRTDAVIPRDSWALPRWMPMAALSKVTAATVATAPARNSTATSGSRPMAARVLPSERDSRSVPTVRTPTVTHTTAMPVDSTARREGRSIDPISAIRKVATPRMPIVDSSVAVDEAAKARPTSPAEKKWVTKAQNPRPRMAVLPWLPTR